MKRRKAEKNSFIFIYHILIFFLSFIASDFNLSCNVSFKVGSLNVNSARVVEKRALVFDTARSCGYTVVQVFYSYVSGGGTCGNREMCFSESTFS